jgi:two-component system, oxyanion-binding sensor
MKEYDGKIYAGFIPLTDCAPLVVAREMAFAEDEGLDLQLARETSWATIRDRLAVGHLDVAHALAPMPLAANLGLNPLSHELVAPIALGSGGNTVTISNALWEELVIAESAGRFDARAGIAALADHVGERRRQGLPRLAFGIVHPHSAHHYELAYWLAVGGIMPGRDIDLVVLPPPLMPAALASGRIDGFCAGAPWGSLAVLERAGHILTTKPHIWRSSPEKVLAVSRAWAEAVPERMSALLRAIYRASTWCDRPENRQELAVLLAKPDYIGVASDMILMGLNRQLPLADGAQVAVDGFLTFAERAATFPWVSHALWFYTQMVRWRQVEFADDHIEIVRRTYRPDLYRAALAPLEVDIPSANAKIEGMLRADTPVGSATGRLTLGSDAFFDGRVFDPDHVRDYIAEDRSLGTSDP